MHISDEQVEFYFSTNYAQTNESRSDPAVYTTESERLSLLGQSATAGLIRNRLITGFARK